MLKRFLIVILLLAAPPALADADRVRDFVVRELREDGYSEIRITRTWLGRLRFVARNGDRRREIVVNPATGVILRDYIRWVRNSGSQGGGSGNGSGGSGGEEDDDDDEDDDENDDENDDDENDDDEDDDEEDGDEDDDEDNSGSGSSGSGSD